MCLEALALSYEEFAKARGSWSTSLENCVDNNIFLTWEWITGWWKHFGQGREFTLIAIMDKGRFVAAAPLMKSRARKWGITIQKMEFVAAPMSDYHNFLLTEKSPEHVKMILDYASQSFPADLIELKEIPEDSALSQILRTKLNERPRFEEKVLGGCPYISLPARWEDYWATLRSSFRRNLRRLERNLRRKYIVEYEICRSDAVKNAMKNLFDLHQARSKSVRRLGIFSDLQTRGFHLDVASSFAEMGWLVLDQLKVNNETVAAGYNFKYGNKLYFYISGSSPTYSQYGVESLRNMYLIKHSIESGMKEYDFMRGEEAYKGNWNTLTRRNLRFRISKNRVRVLIGDLISKMA